MDMEFQFGKMKKVLEMDSGYSGWKSVSPKFMSTWNLRM